MKIVRTQTTNIPSGYDRDKKEKVKGYQIQNHTRLVGLVDGAIGLKNGYTQKARGSFVGAATRGNTTYAAVVLRAQTQSRQATADLLNWAFKQKEPQVQRTVAFEDLSTPSPVASNEAEAGGGSTGKAETDGAQPDEAGKAVSHSQSSGIAIPNKVGLVLGLPVAIFAVAGSVLMYRSRHNRSRRAEWNRKDQEGTST